MENREDLLNQIMEIDFMLKDLNLYLNTHPCSTKAIALFNEFQKRSSKLRSIYTENYGPLTIEDNLDNTNWQWVKSPWPWERMV